MKLSPAFTRCLAYGAIAAGGAGAVLALADVETPLRGPLALLALAGPRRRLSPAGCRAWTCSPGLLSPPRRPSRLTP
jgi:hypothetical protein